MKKYIIALALLLVLASSPIYAKVNDETTIQSLLQQIQQLIVQVTRLIAEQGGVVSDLPVNYRVADDLGINIKSGQQISLPLTLSGTASNVFEGYWGNVKLYDNNNQLLDTQNIIAGCDYGKSCAFKSVTLNGVTVTKDGYLLFTKENPSGLSRNNKTYRVPIKFNLGPATMSLKLFYIAPNDNGVNGEKVGCGDSVVSITRTIEKTTQPLTKAIQLLLAEKRINLGESGLTNSGIFSLSDLKIESVSIQDGVATIKLMGDFKSLGVCDDPRFTAQMTRTALQFPTVKTVDIYVNGIRLDSLLSGRGY